MSCQQIRLTHDQHANQARASARAAGLADCIHYAPSWGRRADALYAEVNAMGMVPEMIGLLPDGRMVTGARLPLTTEELFYVFEVRQ